MLAKAAQSLVSAMRDKITPEFAWKELKEIVYCEQSLAGVYGQGWSARIGLQQCWYQDEPVKQERLTIGVYNDELPYKAERIVALGYRDEIIAKLSENGLTEKISEGIEEGYKHLRDAMQEIRRD